MNTPIAHQSLIIRCALLGLMVTPTVGVTAENQFYVGGQVGLYDSTYVSGYDIDTRGSQSYSVFGGYDFFIRENIAVGAELEYRNVRDGTISNGNDTLADYSANGFSLNVRPKYYFNNPMYYFGAMAGLGYYSIDATPTSENASNSPSDDKHWGLQAGLEFGIETASGFGAALGLSTLNLDVSDIEFGYNMLYLSAKYSF